MADAATNIFIELAKDLITYNYELIRDVGGDFEVIYQDIGKFQAFLLDASNPKCRKSESIRKLIAEIRDITYAAEDAIETYVMLKYDRGVLEQLWDFMKIRHIALDFKDIKLKIDKIKTDKFFDLNLLDLDDNHKRPVAGAKGVVDLAQGDEVVGLEKETEDIVSLLRGESDERRVVAVVGMPGLGKTTLANKVFNDPRIRKQFMYRVWVRVSQEYNGREVLQTIWNKVSDKPPSNLSNLSDAELAAEIRELLTKKHCLIALDDVWYDEVWSELQNCFPRENKNLRILVTTREKKVASLAAEGKPFPLELLDEDKCFQLLEKRVFRREKCPSHLVQLGKDIVLKCGKLPLAIVIVAGVLIQKPTEKGWWKDIESRVTENVATQKCREIVRLSYDNLPCHLRACFLYFGIFPQSYAVDVSNLLCLWIAEGLIKSEDGLELEKQAEMHLEDLVDRNLVMVEDKSSANKIKKCRVHDILHDLCIQEAREENMFYHIKDLKHFREPSQQANWDNYRRLSIHSNVTEYLALKATGVRVRSFLSLGAQVPLPAADCKTFPGAFQLLRVLDASSILLKLLPKPLTKLVHLRYVAIYIAFTILSPDLSNLSKLQILIVKVKSGGTSLEVATNIWKMQQLRHFQTNLPFHFSTPLLKKISKATESNVRTLTFIKPEACTAEFFGKIPNVKKLGIRGDMHKLPNFGKGNDFRQLEELEVLKMKNESVGSSKGRISYFSGKAGFPRKLRQLTLSKTYLSWEEHMETLEKLSNLVVLKLKENAFVGKYWKPTSEGFLNLEVFYLGRTDLEVWDASSDHFPEITTIILRSCSNLKSIPSCFANLPNFQKLDLKNTNDQVVSSARDIEDRRQKEKPGIVFKLSVDH